MKTARYDRHGQPAEVIALIDQPTPTPGPREAVIAVEAAPIHLADLYCMQGLPRFRMPLPHVPGFEGVGTVRAVGAEVRNVRPGERVFLPLACGAWREEICVPADGLLPAPAGDAAQLALLPINPPTSYLVLKDFGDLKPGNWIIQNAANSNCGRYLIELAKLWGIRTVNVVRRPEPIADLTALGGDVVLVDGPDLAARVKDATGAAPIRVGLDAVNGQATQRLADCLADGATLLAYGMAAGENCVIAPDTLFLRDIRLMGFYTVRQFAKRTPAQVRAIYQELVDLFERGQLTAKIAATYPLARVKDAVAHAGRKGAEREGKVILTMR
ncbi:MAG: zinc-dependent alcohol dehydrogenase family protein [Rhodospirillaceae bacterium]|nr:zinc-dependent alcohol dehydrogenase family protein [Rhodospirillaceae bacterium]